MNTTKELKQATVVVRAIEPAQNGRSGKIKTDKGIFGVWPEKIGLFNTGEEYEIDYAETFKGNVCYKDVRNVKHLGPYTPTREQKAAEMSRRPAPQINPLDGEVIEPKRTPGEPPPPTSPADYGFDDNRYWTPKPRRPVEQEQIFASMGVKCDIERGRISDDEDSLVECTNKWRRVWQRTFGKQYDRA